MPQNVITRAVSSVIALLLALIMTFFGRCRSTVEKIFHCCETETVTEEVTTEFSTEPESETITESTTESTTQGSTESTTESTAVSTAESTTESTTESTEETTAKKINDVTAVDSGAYIKSYSQARKMYFGGSKTDSVTAGATGSDGAYYCCGTTESADGDFTSKNSASNGAPASFVMRIERNGSVGWLKVKGDTNYKYYFTSMACLSDGNIAVGGYMTKKNVSAGQSMKYQSLVLIYDKTGIVKKTILLQGSENAFIDCIAATPEGFAIGGKTDCHDGNFTFVPNDFKAMYGFVIYYDNSGKILSSMCYGGSAGAEVKGMSSDKNGNVFLGITTASRDGDFAKYSGFVKQNSLSTVVVKVDSTGKEKWGRVFSTSKKTDFSYISADGSGGCIAGGNVDEFSGLPDGFLASVSHYSGTNVCIYRLSGADGSTLWNYTMRGIGNKYIEDVCCFSGGIAVVGEYNTASGDFPKNHGDYDGFTALFSPAGKLKACINNGGSDTDKTTVAVYANSFLKVFGNSLSTDNFFDGMNTNVTPANIMAFGTVFDCFSVKYQIDIY